ncbi:LIV-I protein F [Thalassovita autumnalis]|uniref:LIV-I protein F n=1 Tax=Thalassovita autumnalis TaxID=2072972 RepID=A0A0P1F9P0_9RHOB|nr:ABC transporter ATP-binding protein [Thalassovita autumnalis]CUH64758.1 LIV-I protein F [Thalassovita autumnalis]CUH72650.1 LIV-I protein F [Thalassovita autumnalis]
MLEINNLSISYGAHLALDGAALFAAQGETVAILGANGAGKSSLLKSLTGMVAPQEGSSAKLFGEELVGRPAHEIVERGVIAVPEGRGVFGEMSVEENLLLGANPLRARKGEQARRDEVFDLFPRLAERKSQLVRTMSGGEQQMVAIGRALMSRPDLLLLDEPSLGLAPIVIGQLFDALAQIKSQGLTILIVEQNVRASLQLADRGYLIEAGRITGSGTAEDLKSDDAVQHAFLGGASAQGAS